MIVLRDYQKKLIDDTREAYAKGYRSPCVVSPCGSGKSVVIGMIAKMTADKGGRVLFLVHRRELVDQIKNTFLMCGVDMDYVEIAMVQTVVRRLDKTVWPRLIITDENHHCLANSYRKIYDYFSDVLRVGFTATPCRLNGGGLGDVNDILVMGLTVSELIERKCLAKYRYFAPSTVDTSTLKTRRGEYVDVDRLFENKFIFGDVIEHYKKLAQGKKTICYCSSIAKSKEMAAAFVDSGIRSCHIDGTTPKLLRDEIINDFRAGKIDVLCNVDLISEGFDVPDCEAVILLRPTQSLGLYIQQAMRCMRYNEGKTAIIIDHVGNVNRFGLPDKERAWTLDSKKAAMKTVEENAVKQCDECYFTCLAKERVCPNCGHEFRRDEKEVLEIDSELTEFTGFVVDHRSPSDCKSMKELYDLAKNRGYKRGWAYHQGKMLNYI